MEMDSCSATFSGQCYRLILSESCVLYDAFFSLLLEPGNRQQHLQHLMRTTLSSLQRETVSHSPLLTAGGRNEHRMMQLTNHCWHSDLAGAVKGGEGILQSFRSTSSRHNLTRYDREKHLAQISRTITLSNGVRYTHASPNTRPKSLPV
jgi:hypothetical protein